MPQYDSPMPESHLTEIILAQIASLGYRVQVYRLRDKLEMHAVSDRARHIASVDCEDGEYRCACLLAEMVEIDLE